MKVILIVNVVGLEDLEIFNEHLKEEGFSPVEEEDSAYSGETSTSLLQTKTYILAVVKEGLQKSGFETCKIIFQIGDNPMHAYLFSKKEDSFESVDLDNSYL